MGQLRHARTARAFTLSGRTILGRAPTVDCVIASPRVSGEHARFWWEDGAWWVRDLGSRNGTLVDGSTLEPGRALRLSPGARLCFGDPRDPWVWMDDLPPVVVARSGELEVVGEAWLLALPSEEEVVATVMSGPKGTWLVESQEGTALLETRQSIVVAGQTWRVHLPVVVDATRAADEVEDGGAGGPGSWQAAFTVSSDEEFAQLVLVDPVGQELSLTPRVFHYTLLTLARARLQDADDDPTSPGWRYVEDLCRDLRIDRADLNQHVYRARKQLRRLGRPDGPELVERRPSADQLRFGLARITVNTG